MLRLGGRKEIPIPNPQAKFATATIDCAAPIISNVQNIEVDWGSAVVGFDTSELAVSTLHWGSSCGALTETANAGPTLEHRFTLSDLSPETPYFYAMDVVDGVGNGASDDNGGQCYTFTILDQPVYYTEQFGSTPDLAGLSLTFAPNGSGGYYGGCVTDITGLPVDPTGARRFRSE